MRNLIHIYKLFPNYNQPKRYPGVTICTASRFRFIGLFSKQSQCEINKLELATCNNLSVYIRQGGGGWWVEVGGGGWRWVVEATRTHSRPFWGVVNERMFIVHTPSD